MSIDDLKAQRAQLSGKLSDVMAARARLRQAEGEETKILAAIGDLGKDEIDALREWARSGEGPKPEPDVEARRDLHDKLVAAQAAAENARGVHSDLDVEEREVASTLTDINAKIELSAIDTLLEERAQELVAFEHFLTRQVAPKIARLFGLHAAIIEMAQRHQNSGRSEAAMPLFQRAERLSYARPQVDLDPAPGVIVAASSEWAKRFAELTSDAPASNVVVIGDAA